MNTAYLFDYYAVGGQSLVALLRSGARATGTHGAVGRRAQRTDAIPYRVVDALRTQNRPLIDCLITFLITFLITLLITEQQKHRFYAG